MTSVLDKKCAGLKYSFSDKIEWDVNLHSGIRFL